MSKFAAATEAYRTFTDNFNSIILSTVSADGLPNASYAPCVIDKARNIYIYVSGLASHTQNLQAVPKASILFIEDEQNSQQIFARKRLSYDCNASLIPSNDPEWTQVADQFEQRFGKMVELLRSLPDFRIFKLTPTQGRFVVGFGAAFAIDGEDLTKLIHVKGA
jgi:heme iron utilization protein